MFKKISLAALATSAVSAQTSWNVGNLSTTTLTAFADGTDTVKFVATVPAGTWFGLGFGVSKANSMLKTDIILFNATEFEDDKKK